jgi:hypothetical protein
MDNKTPVDLSCWLDEMLQKYLFSDAIPPFVILSNPAIYKKTSKPQVFPSTARPS